jgi:hypothetical protein
LSESLREIPSGLGGARFEVEVEVEEASEPRRDVSLSFNITSLTTIPKMSSESSLPTSLTGMLTLRIARADEEDALTASLDLLRRLPPNRVTENLDSLVTILPDLTDDLLSSVDQPLKVQSDRENGGKDYLVSTPPTTIPPRRSGTRG